MRIEYYLVGTVNSDKIMKLCILPVGEFSQLL